MGKARWGLLVTSLLREMFAPLGFLFMTFALSASAQTRTGARVH